LKTIVALLAALVLLPAAFAQKSSSDDPVIKNLHWLGPINGQTNILRCASPSMDIAAKVKAGQTLLIIEAMKMENNLIAQKDGVVREIRVQKGTEVSTGDIIMVIH